MDAPVAPAHDSIGDGAKVVRPLMELVDSSRGQLLDYLGRQLAHFFPDDAETKPTLDAHLDEALARLEVCIAAVKMWTPGRFHHLHSEQNTHFLYYLANTIWRRRGNLKVATKLFYLNKALNGFHCFYDTDLPQRFQVGHSVGIVLVRARYPEHFVIYQGSTLGRNDKGVPELGEGLIMYPGSAIVGRCAVGPRTVLAQGASLVDTDTPGDCIVFPGGDGGRAVIKPSKHDYIAEFFRA
jgi:serine O-acetyltransferase